MKGTSRTGRALRFPSRAEASNGRAAYDATLQALGATTVRILRLFVHRPVRLCLPLVVAGSFAVGVLRLIAIEIGPTTSPAVWSIPLVAGGFAALVVAAIFLSSRKAATVDPALTMRIE